MQSIISPYAFMRRANKRTINLVNINLTKRRLLGGLNLLR
jgi:hypothetical protein